MSKPSVLIVGHPRREQFSYAADFVNSIQEVKDFDYPVVVLPAENLDATAKVIKKIDEQSPQTQLILAAEKFDADGLHMLQRQTSHKLIFTQFVANDFEYNIRTALERHDFQVRDAANVKREKNQLRSQKRFTNLNLQTEALHKALLAVHSALSVSEIETQLFSALSTALNLNWVRVFLFSNDHLENQLSRIQGQKLFKAPLTIDSRSLGKLVIARNDNKDFTKGEEESLFQITESVALALDRLAKLDQAETLKLQWDSTFDAISEPLCLTDEKFNIIRTNKAFLNVTKLKSAQALGNNCFSAFCGPHAPTQVAPSPTALVIQRIDKGSKEPNYYEVTTQRIHVAAGTPSILMVLFRNVTEQKKIEKQIFESSKMAELGTIGSSIAHDINNPLGGMINFIQLIKMDLKPEHPHYEDILEMEAAGQRCKEIVENLLRFSRRQENVQSEKIDLNDLVRHTLKIIELQTRSLGIQVEAVTPEDKTEIMGQSHLLTQALNYVLQNSFDAVSEKLSSTPGYKGQIKVEVLKNKDQISLTVIDNGVGIQPEVQNKILNPLFSTKNKKHGLGLTLAFQIVAEHSGRLEIFSQPNVGTTVKISFANV